MVQRLFVAAAAAFAATFQVATASTVTLTFETLEPGDSELIDGADDIFDFSTTDLSWNGTTPAVSAELQLTDVERIRPITVPSTGGSPVASVELENGSFVFIDVGDPTVGLSSDQTLAGTNFTFLGYTGTARLFLEYADATLPQSAADVGVAFGEAGGSLTLLDPAQGAFQLTVNAGQGAAGFSLFTETSDPSRLLTSMLFFAMEDTIGGAEVFVSRGVTTTVVPVPASSVLFLGSIGVLLVGKQRRSRSNR